VPNAIEIGPLGKEQRTTELLKEILSLRELASEICEGLTGQETESELLQSYISRFLGSQELKVLISELSTSSDCWSNLFYSRPWDLVRIAYLGILGREPDIKGRAHYAERLEKERDFVAILKDLLSSEEFLVKIFQDKLNQDPIRAALSHAEFNKLIQLKPLFPKLEYIDLVAMAAKISVLKQASPVREASRIHIIFVFLDKKDHDSLVPVVDQLKLIKGPSIEVGLLSIYDALNLFIKDYSSRFVFIGAIERAKYILESIGVDDLFIYMEHGVAPLKTYTYAPHYRRYNYSLLPGDLWCERLEFLYPELKGRLYSVGYPKLHIKPISLQDRLAYCARFNLDPDKKIILFAPTWSGGFKDAGIFNIRFLRGLSNLIAIPHDGDRAYSDMLKGQGFPIYSLESESISYHYSFADLLVSDYSSTAIEFARIGKPVICINAMVYNDYDKSCLDESNFLKIPHTPYRWDFCPMSNREGLRNKIDLFLEQSIWTSNAELVGKMCDSYGDEATAKSVNAIASIIKTEFKTEILA